MLKHSLVIRVATPLRAEKTVAIAKKRTTPIHVAVSTIPSLKPPLPNLISNTLVHTFFQ